MFSENLVQSLGVYVQCVCVHVLKASAVPVLRVLIVGVDCCARVCEKMGHGAAAVLTFGSGDGGR